MTDESKPAAPADETAQIGRGALYLTMTKLYFIVGSYAIYFGLPRLGGIRGDALFADYKKVGALLSVIGTVLVMGTTQAIARFVGKEPHKARGIARRGLMLQMGFGALIAGGYFLIAPLIARDDALVDAIRISALIPFVYAMYSVFMGTLNGEKRFAEQALMDGGFTTLKIVCVLGFVAVFQTAAGGYAGFAVAACAVFVSSGLIVRRGHRSKDLDIGADPSGKSLFLFQIQTVGFMLVVQSIVQLDIWYVGWWGGWDEMLPEGQTLTQAQAAGALYGSAQLFSQISYAVVISLTFVLFPLISGLGEDVAAARRYVREAVRYALIMVVGVAAVLTAAPANTLDLLLRSFSQARELVPGGEEALRWLGLGYVSFSVLFVLCAVLNAAGRPRQSILLMLIVLCVQVGLGYLWLPQHGIVGQGVAGLVGMSVGLAVGLWFMARWIGNVFPIATCVRVLIAGAAVYAIGMLWHPDGKMITLVRCVACGALYLLLVVVMREFQKADLEKFRKVLPGGKKA